MRFCHVPIQVSQDGFMLRVIRVFLGCNLPKQLLLKSLSYEYNDRLEDWKIISSCTDSYHELAMKYVTFYA